MALNGIDVSKWQGDIAIEKLKCDFVIVKATQGTSYVNPYFEKQVSKTLSSGKLIGFYHYASKGGAENEAKHFLSVVKPYIGKAILVLDWEGQGNENYGNTTTAAAYAKKFLDYIYSNSGVRPLFYISKSATSYKGMDTIKNAGYKLWVAQYGKNNIHNGFNTNPALSSSGYGPWDKPLIYQYTSKGRLNGYSGDLDFNIAYMTKEDWQKEARSKNKNSNEITYPAKFKVKSYNLNLRSGPNVSSSILGAITSGSEVTVTKREGDFIKISGWISTKHIINA